MPADSAQPFTLVHGVAPSLRKRVIDEIVAAALPEEEREWGLVQVDAGEVGVEGVVAQIAGGSLMASERVVVVRDVDKLSNSAQKALAKELGRVSDGTFVVLEAAPSPSGGYKRKGPPVAADLRKAVDARGRIIEASAPRDRELPTWVADEIRARGKTISPRVAMLFVEITGAAIESIINEIEKVVTYVGDEREEVTEDDVRQIVTGERENSIFDLVDAIGKRDARTALSVLPELLPASGRQGEAMPMIGMIARHFRLVWQARVLADAGRGAASSPEKWADKFPEEHNFFDATKGRSFLVRKYSEQARNFRDVQLVRAFIKIHETDLALKGQTDERMDDRLALETLIISLCRL